MSETTRKLRKFGEGCEGHKLIDWYHMYLGMDLAADAIEAVEAKVAEAVARVAALEKRGIDAQGGNRSGESPAGKLAPTGSSESGLGTDRGASSAHASPPAPSAVPAPRGFRVGDKVRTDQGAEHTISDVAGDGYWLNGRLRESGIAYRWPAHRLTLVRAAATPEAPAEDAGLVERLAEVWIKSVDPKLSWPTGASDPIAVRRGTRGILAAMTAESRLCAPGEVARLTADRDDWKYAAEVQKKDTESWKARAETAEKELAEARAISAATAERVRNETQIATELRHDLADARDRIASKDRSIEVMLAETRALREALDAERSGVATKLHDAGFNNVENLVGAYRFERAQADAIRFSARTWFNAAGEPELLATAEEVTERRKAAAKELAALRAKPRFRTRPVTAADLDELEREYNKADYKANEEYRAARALGFRRRVDGAK